MDWSWLEDAERVEEHLYAAGLRLHDKWICSTLLRDEDHSTVVDLSCSRSFASVTSFLLGSGDISCKQRDHESYSDFLQAVVLQES